MARDNAQFLEALSRRDPVEIARDNMRFLGRLPPESKNESLQRALTSVVHVVRLGSMHLPSFIDLEALAHAQTLLLAGVEQRDAGPARDAMVVLGQIEIPQEAGATPSDA